MFESGGMPAKDTVLSFLRDWAKDNPQSASLVFGGIACFAAVAFVYGLGIRFESDVAPAIYIVGVGIGLIVATIIVNNKLMMSVLSWFVFILAIFWVIAFIAYKAIPTSPTVSQQLSCVIWFWKDCKNVIDAETRTNTVAAPSVLAPSAPIAGNIQPEKYQVFVQFAGVLSRDDIRDMMQKLKTQGWNVQGVVGGGQRTSLAAGISEVRYADGDEAAAQSLAASVQAFGLSARKVNAVPNSSIVKGNLEVWISR